nr:hypothetical protein [Tanacetum cinerariifolium]
FKVIVHGKVYWIHAKELDTWVSIFCNGNYDSLSSDEEPFDADAGRKCGDTVNVNATDEHNDVDRVSESSFVHENVSMNGINNILRMINYNIPNVCTTVDKDVEEGVIQKNVKPEHNVTSGSNNKIGSFNCSSTQSNRDSHFQKVKDGGSILEVLVTREKRMDRGVMFVHRVDFVAIQETKMKSMDLFSVKALWGNLSIDYAFSRFDRSSVKREPLDLSLKWRVRM